MCVCVCVRTRVHVHTHTNHYKSRITPPESTQQHLFIPSPQVIPNT